MESWLHVWHCPDHPFQSCKTPVSIAKTPFLGLWAWYTYFFSSCFSLPATKLLLLLHSYTACVIVASAILNSDVLIEAMFIIHRVSNLHTAFLWKPQQRSIHIQALTQDSGCGQMHTWTRELRSASQFHCPNGVTETSVAKHCLGKSLLCFHVVHFSGGTSCMILCVRTSEGIQMHCVLTTCTCQLLLDFHGYQVGRDGYLLPSSL